MIGITSFVFCNFYAIYRYKSAKMSEWYLQKFSEEKFLLEPVINANTNVIPAEFKNNLEKTNAELGQAIISLSQQLDSHVITIISAALFVLPTFFFLSEEERILKVINPELALFAFLSLGIGVLFLVISIIIGIQVTYYTKQYFSKRVDSLLKRFHELGAEYGLAKRNDNPTDKQNALRKTRKHWNKIMWFGIRIKIFEMFANILGLLTVFHFLVGVSIFLLFGYLNFLSFFSIQFGEWVNPPRL